MTKPLLLAINPWYSGKFLQWHNLDLIKVGSLYKVSGFKDYNFALDINKIFSTHPMGDLIDRSGHVFSPYNFAVLRPWAVPTHTVSLEDFFAGRVKFYTSHNAKCNVCWSGGIDSSSMLTAFLQHTDNLDQLRILYSPYSLYENFAFYEFVRSKFPQVEMVDISGDVYLEEKFDGIMINGHGGDEFTASLDQSFHEVAHSALGQPWQDYFSKSNSDPEFMDFCQQFFDTAKRPIQTLLEARWWFYAVLKSQIFSVRDNSFVQHHPTKTELGLTSSFFDCDDFESFVYFNTEQIIDNASDYVTYKKFLRRYTYQFNQDSEHLNHAAKSNSHQFLYYLDKKMCLQDRRWIFKLEDGTIIRTANLPLLSKKEFVEQHGNTLDYLFNFG